MSEHTLPRDLPYRWPAAPGNSNKNNSRQVMDPRTCSICGKNFTAVCSRKLHEKTHYTSYECQICHKRFTRKTTLRHHMKTLHNNGAQSNSSFTCRKCGKHFTLARTLKRHEETHSTSYECNVCFERFTRRYNLKKHVKRYHTITHDQTGGQQNVTSNSAERHVQGALNGRVKLKTFHAYHQSRYDLLSFLAGIRSKVKRFIRQRVNQHAIKWYVVARVQLYREDPDGNERIVDPFFRSVTYRLLTADEFTDHDLNEAFQKVVASLERYIHESSGWMIKSVQTLQVHTISYRPLAASSYIDLPSTLKRSGSLLNIKNSDNKCFLYCILAKLHSELNYSEQVLSYLPYERELAVKGLQFPMPLTQIDRFEALNETISVNVFGFENSEIIPLRITKHTRRRHHVNLLFIKKNGQSHYCLIKDFDRFLYRTKSRKCKHFFCYFCLNSFTNKRMLSKHIPLCRNHGAQKVVMPIQGHNDTVTFKDYLKQLRLPFVIYCDFETLNRQIDTCENAPNKSQTVPKKLLDVSSFGYKVVCSVDSNYRKSVRIYRGKDASSKFLECLLEEQSEIQELLKRNEPIKMTGKDIKHYRNATHCYICGEVFEETQEKCRDHCHLTGKYRGAAHMTCNLLYKTPSFIPVVIHNLRGFDGHLIAQSLGQFDGKISCIPQNLEKYLSVSFQNLRFIDSLQFLSASLDALVADLKMDTENLDYNFRHFFSEFKNRKDAKGLLQKNAYPYDYMDCETKFEETRLPPIDCFYSSIKDQGISQDEYDRACQLFDRMGLRNLGEWSDLYLKTDVLLLCSVFENFRDVTMDEFRLDPVHFYSSPGLSWAAMLKMTKVELQLLTDIDMLHFVRRGQRGGISFIGHRHAVANNPLVPNYDPSKPLSYIQLLDANNLYGWAMSQPLPKGGFRFLKERELQHLDILNVPDDNRKGYLVEVSLHYPKKIHDLHNGFPLAPEKKCITNDQLSPYAKALWLQLHRCKSGKIVGRSKQEKLITDLHDKDHYVVHYRNLKLYVQLGMEIKSIHRALEFDQDTWLKCYIDFNTQKRKIAKTQFKKNFYKILNCSVFGKMMEDQLKYKNISLVTNPKGLKRMVSKPTFETCKIFHEKLVATQCRNASVTITKPVYVGQAVLDLSKVRMYDFYYNYLKSRYGAKCNLLMTDTDSFLYEIRDTKSDLYVDMRDYMYLFDTSDYPQDHFLHSDRNKKVLGKFKDETNGKAIERFCGLRSKLYVYKVVNTEEEVKKAKGVCKAAVKKKLYITLYEEALFKNTETVLSMDLIRSHSHILKVETLYKKCLSSFDDKRYLKEDGVSSYAYGHYKIKE